jgi:hypothetical protein
MKYGFARATFVCLWHRTKGTADDERLCFDIVHFYLITSLFTEYSLNPVEKSLPQLLSSKIRKKDR